MIGVRVLSLMEMGPAFQPPVVHDNSADDDDDYNDDDHHDGSDGECLLQDVTSHVAKQHRMVRKKRAMCDS